MKRLGTPNRNPDSVLWASLEIFFVVIVKLNI